MMSTFGNMNFAFLNGKSMLIKRKTAINFGRENAVSILSKRWKLKLYAI